MQASGCNNPAWTERRLSSLYLLDYIALSLKGLRLIMQPASIKGMIHCYRCGSEVEGKAPYQRRKVKTGEWLRRRYPKRTVSSANFHYGWRVVCHACARQIDLDYRRGELLEWLKLALALLVLFAILLIEGR